MPFNESLVDQGALFYKVEEGQTAPPVGDGKTYSRALGWQSPEGNFYGHERWVRDWPSPVVWTGEDYISLEVDGSVNSVSELELKKPPHRIPVSWEIWTVPRANWPPQDLPVYDGRTKEYYFWNVDTQDFQLIDWYWDIDGEDNLPRPGLKIGAAHVLYYYDIKVFWDGITWRRYPLDMLDGSERVDSLESNYTSFITNTNGAIQIMEDTIDSEVRARIAEARLDFVSKTSLGLFTSVKGNTGALWVGGELLLTEDVANVLSTSDTVYYTEGIITYGAASPNTEYYVYCGNSQFPIASGLFLSLTPDSNGKLGIEEPGTHARIVGRVETDSSGYFVREIDMSFIGKKVEFSETYWEYSDYTLTYVDKDTLEFKQIDGTSGLCYINGQLLELGTGKELSRLSPRIIWNSGNIQLDETDIATDTIYQIYIANDSYEYNFNVVGNDGFPLDEGDIGYDATLDFRRGLFLSTKAHDHRLFDEQYPGYYARHIGQVATDSLGYFKYSSDISLIRQPTLNPTTLDGLAEITFLWESSSQIGIIAKRGTNGLVFVNGEQLTVAALDCSYINSDSSVYSYNTGITYPLDVVDTVKDYIGRQLYLYITNTNNVWGSVANSLICSSDEPVVGHLSGNYPGNNCRWIGTIRQAPLATGNDLVVNGAFATDTDWVYDKGWTFDTVNKKMTHVSGVLPLSQDVTLTEGQRYRIQFSTSGANTGSVKVSLGGTESASFSNNAVQDVDIVAGAGDYVYFVPTQTYNGSIDSVSLKITSLNLATNGTCDADTSWTKGTGWSYDSANKHYDHTPIYDWLTNDITLTNSASYKLTFDVTLTSGTSITPCLGGTDGSAVTSSGTGISQNLTAGTSNYIRFKASADFVGSIDNVALYNIISVTNGNFVGSSGWTVDTAYWTLPGGSASHSGLAAGYLYQSLPLINGHSYSLTYTYTAGVGSSIQAYIGGTAGTSRINTGTYTETIVAGSNGILEFVAAAEEGSSYVNSVSITDATNIFSDGAFSSGANWTCESGWSIGSGVASHVVAPDYLTQDITLSSGSTYVVGFTTSGGTTGTVTPCLSGTNGSAVSANQANSVEIVAGADNYLRFIATDDFNGNIDSVSIKLTGSELSANGTFETDTSWDKPIGWYWDGVSYYMDRLPVESLPISQDIGAVENEYYRVTFSITNYTSGTITPYVGGVAGTPESSNGYKTQYILAGDSATLEFISSPLYVGSLDSVSAYKTLGVFENSFLSESVTGLSAAINDSVISYSDTWSSARIMAEIQKAVGISSAEQTFENQKVIGVSTRLEYVDSTHIRLIPTISGAKVFFSADTNDYLEMPSGGMDLAVTGSVNTMYCVWLEKSNFYMNTSVPTTEYQNLSMTRDAVLVGYVVCAGINSISGDWNVYSCWNEPNRSWTSGAIGSGNFTFTKTGLLVPPNGSATVTRSGAATLTGTACAYFGNSPMGMVSVSASATIGEVTYELPSVGPLGYFTNIGGGGPQVSAGSGSLSIVISSGTLLTSGIYNSISITETVDLLSSAAYYLIGESPYSNARTNSVTSRTGNLTIIRQGNMN